MINTEVCLFVKRTEIELEHIHNKLRVLMALAEDDGIADCIDTAENMVNDVRSTAKDAAEQIDSIGGSLWSRMYHLEQEQEKAAKAAAEAEDEAAKAATTNVALEKTLKDTLNAWDQARKANAAAEDDDPMGIGAELLKAKAAAAECKGCGCDSEELADYGCAGCTCSKADEAEGGELNG